jgi:hypothetical protein
MKAGKSLAICTACAVLVVLVSCVELPPDERVAPPWFPVSEQFTASGFMGEAAYPQALKLRMNDCVQRDPNALGQCFPFHWTRPPVDDVFMAKVPADGAGWLGVYWQSPPANWGEKTPKYVEAGAQYLHFKVRGSFEGKPANFKGKVNIQLGGIIKATYPYQDVFSRQVGPFEFDDTKWSEYKVLIMEGRPGDNFGKSPFSGKYKDGAPMLGPFAWIYRFSENADAPENFSIYFDDIVWGWEPPEE